MNEQYGLFCLQLFAEGSIKIGQLQCSTFENLSKCATGGVHRGGCMPARERAP